MKGLYFYLNWILDFQKENEGTLIATDIERYFIIKVNIYVT